MDFKVIWSDAAIADLDDIGTFIASDNPRAAVKVAQGIIDHTGLLAGFPFIGPSYPRGSNGSLREIFFYSYRIFYDVSEATQSVEILHVWHMSRDEPVF